MRKKILISLFGIFMLFYMFATISALYNVQIYNTPYNDVFTSNSRNGKTLYLIKNELNFKSCNVESYWKNGTCQYLYFCYAILPSTSTKISDALRRECIEVSDLTTASLEVKDFLPPKGVLYYVVTFFGRLSYVYINSTIGWQNGFSIPTPYINASAIRSVCPEGQMLDFDAGAGQYKCYISKRICLDTLQTGLCTNSYTLWALDKNNDGVVDINETKTGSSLCADRGSTEYPNGDGICDLTRDLGCVDVCSKYDMVDGTLTCTFPGANQLCDEWDMASFYSCFDDVLSPNSKICDTIDSSLCSVTYNPVCVANVSGTIIGGQTFPNDCYAKAKGYNACPTGTTGTNCYVSGSCQPPITQCYSSEDCPVADVCRGGTLTGISKLCLDYRCSYSGACGNLGCITDADCSNLPLPCVGVSSKCQAGFCTFQGSCMVKPTPTNFNIWSWIQSYWNTFWNWVKSLFGT